MRRVLAVVVVLASLGTGCGREDDPVLTPDSQEQTTTSAHHGG